MNTDAYLERPYAVAADDEARHEAFQDTHQYRGALYLWVECDDATRQRFEATDAYTDAFEAWAGGDRD